MSFNSSSSLNLLLEFFFSFVFSKRTLLERWYFRIASMIFENLSKKQSIVTSIKVAEKKYNYIVHQLKYIVVLLYFDIRSILHIHVITLIMYFNKIQCIRQWLIILNGDWVASFYILIHSTISILSLCNIFNPTCFFTTFWNKWISLIR